MQVWSRDPITSKLIMTKSSPQPNQIMTQLISLQDRFYPIRTSLSSCIQLPEAESKSFEIKPQFINTLPHCHGLESEDAYFFIREFEEVSLMIRIPQLGDNAVRLSFVPIALKDLAKKWLYSLTENSITL